MRCPNCMAENAATRRFCAQANAVSNRANSLLYVREAATRDEGSVRSAHVLSTRFYAPIFVL
jgi:hypothetical protein